MGTKRKDNPDYKAVIITDKNGKRRTVYKLKRKKIGKCKQRVSKKIAENVRKFRDEKKFASRSQAIAVAFSQTIKTFPRCKQHLKKREMK